MSRYQSDYQESTIWPLPLDAPPRTLLTPVAFDSTKFAPPPPPPPEPKYDVHDGEQIMT
jgi:hypothetical protein